MYLGDLQRPARRRLLARPSTRLYIVFSRPAMQVLRARWSEVSSSSAASQCAGWQRTSCIVIVFIAMGLFETIVIGDRIRRSCSIRSMRGPN